MLEPSQKVHSNAVYKQSYALNLFIAVEIVYFCCFGEGGNLDILDFQQKSSGESCQLPLEE